MTTHRKFRLGVLISGRGSNFAAIQNAIEQGQLPNAEIAVVISNHSNAGGISLAQEKGLNTATFEKSRFASREAFDQAVADTLNAHHVDLVILAGYDRIISEPLLKAFPEHILNIHPSLLPEYGGKGMLGTKVHQAVITNQEKESGCSVHVVTDVVDGGTVLGQSRVPVLEDDTPESLAARVLEQEHQLYPQVIREFIDNYFAAIERRTRMKIMEPSSKTLLTLAALGMLFFSSGCQQDVVHQRSMAELNQKAQVMMNAGDYDGAIARLEAAHDLQPEEPTTTYNLAIAYQMKGDYDKAIATFQQVMGKPGINQAEVQKALGISYEGKADKLTAAAKEQEEAPKPDPAKVKQLKQEADVAYHQALDSYKQAESGLQDPEAVRAQIKALEDNFKKQESGVPQ